jgi:hypothetical protein
MDDETGLLHFKEFRTKRSRGLADSVKLDAMEAQALTGAEVLQEQGEALEGCKSSETVIRSSGAMEARRKRNRARTGVRDGETGRGDARNSAVEVGVSDLRLYFFGILQ